jgi:hypothetical protein
VRWKGYSLPYTVFDKDQRVTHAAITENKRYRAAINVEFQRQSRWDCAGGGRNGVRA